MKLAKTLIILETSVANNNYVKSYIIDNFTKIEEIPIFLHNNNNKIILYKKNH